MPSKVVCERGECPVQLGGGHSRALVSMDGPQRRRGPCLGAEMEFETSVRIEMAVDEVFDYASDPATSLAGPRRLRR